VLTDAELTAIWRACGDDDFGRIVRLLILLGARRQEVGGMRMRSELDLDRGTWTLPAERSKNGRAHTLPLLPMALAIIDAVPKMATRDQLFGVRADGYTQWEDGKAALDKRSGVTDWVLHDIRRTVATRMADLGIGPHVIEQVLNHVSGHKSGVAGIYNRSSYEREVRAALALWHDHLRSIVEGSERKIVSMPHAAS
jgi:integrase